MKKLIILTVCALVTLVFVSCGNKVKYESSTKTVNSSKEYVQILQNLATEDTTGVILEEVYADSLKQVYLFKLIKGDKVSFQYIRPTEKAAMVHYLTKIERSPSKTDVLRHRTGEAFYELKFKRGSLKLYKGKNEVASAHLVARVKQAAKAEKELTPDDILKVE